jgi:NhaP-type Na+/H+ or K+/H+ antiporter
LFGDLLFPFVSLSVAIILFEGGLSLKWPETQEVRGVLRLLITLGALVTWIIATLAAVFILKMDVLLSILLGAILVVTGPTVVIPLLRQIRPSRRVSSILKWEGILIDPIGATLAVLVVEAILDSGGQTSLDFFHIAQGIVVTLLVGMVVGVIVGLLLVEFLRRNWIAHYLETAVALMTVLAAFAFSNEIAPESGLIAATIMGIVLANQKKADVRHITAFKEELGVLLLSVLFIVLAARVNLTAVSGILLPEILFLGVLILVARPLAVWVSAIGSKLSSREKLFLASLAPRGIVAVAVASLFALELEESGFAGADQLVNITFLVVVGTVVVYSLIAGPLARRLGLVQQRPQGILIVGAHNWARQIALSLQEAGFEVWLVDANGGRVDMAHHMGLRAFHDSILSDGILDDLPLERIGRLLALTANSELNTLACLRFDDWLGEDHVYQLLPMRDDAPERVDENLLGWLLFGPEVSYDLIDRMYSSGARPVCRIIEDIPDIFYEPAALLLFVITPDGRLRIPTISDPITPRLGERAIYLMPPETSA